MYSKLQLGKKYLQYWLRASNGKGHGIHSPFVFDLVTKVLNDDRQFYCYQTIERLRGQLLKNNTQLAIEDFGAGSRVQSHHQRSVSSIALSALKPQKFGKLFFRLVNYFQPQHIVELGTSLGITTAYMASANPAANVTTMEGAKAVAKLAKANFKELGLANIRVVEGDFDDTLPQVLKQIKTVDFVFVDGNHRKKPTLQYFEQLLKNAGEQSVFIFDDIHWSKEMEEAWHEIQQHRTVTLTIDLFFIGLVFFRKEHKEKEHFVIRF